MFGSSSYHCPSVVTAIFLGYVNQVQYVSVIITLMIPRYGRFLIKTFRSKSFCYNRKSIRYISIAALIAADISREFEVRGL